MQRCTRCGRDFKESTEERYCPHREKESEQTESGVYDFTGPVFGYAELQPDQYNDLNKNE